MLIQLWKLSKAISFEEMPSVLDGNKGGREGTSKLLCEGWVHEDIVRGNDDLSVSNVGSVSYTHLTLPTKA